VPRQFDSGQPSTDSAAQPAAAILVIPEGQGTGEHAPRLDFVDDQGFGGAGVKPRSGPETQTFTFRVKYRDQDDHPPFTGSPRVHVQRTDNKGPKLSRPMERVGTSQGWVIYEYSGALNLDPGSYKHRFSAEDSTRERATGPPTSFRPGPTIRASD
jgi:hypothetical protein